MFKISERECEGKNIQIYN